jgi:hypothetical protein
MSDDLICRTEIFNNTHPCFINDQGDCVAVTIKECGLDLEEIPENEQTQRLFKGARTTGLSTILSHADAREVAKERVLSPSAKSFYDMITYQNRVRQEADRFMATAQQVIQKMRAKKQ